MKKSFLCFLFLAIVSFSYAQLRKIPADVTDAFTIRYPHATHVEWRDKLQYFEATFILNGSTITADFSSKGDWQSSERIMNFEDLDPDVKEGFKKSKYADWDKKSVTEMQELAKPLQYKISVYKSSLQKKNLIFDVNGKLLKETIVL